MTKYKILDIVEGKYLCTGGYIPYIDDYIKLEYAQQHLDYLNTFPEYRGLYELVIIED